MTDVRRGLPSASSMYRVANCPGSVALSNAVKREGKYYELPNPYAAAGTRIHSYLALECLGKYEEAEAALQSRDELRIAQKCIELRESVITHWLASEDALVELVIEKRFWFRQGLWPRFSGQPDFVIIDRTNRRGLVCNYKSGRKESEDAKDNIQLRTEIVLLAQVEPDLEEIDGVVIEPLVAWDSVRVSYKRDTLLEATSQVLAIVDRASWEPNNRIPGAWCEYCPGRVNCPECLDYIQTVPNPEVMRSVVQELPRGEPGVRLWEKIKLAKKLLKTLEDTYEKIMEDEPGALPGYVLPKLGREKRVIPDPAKLKAALAEYLTDTEVDGCGEFYLGKLQEALGTKLKLVGKELERTFDKLVRDVVVLEREKPFIRSLTKKERESAAKLTEPQEALAI